MRIILVIMTATQVFLSCSQTLGEGENQRQSSSKVTKDTFGAKPVWLDKENLVYDVLITGENVEFQGKELSQSEFKIELEEVLSFNYLEESNSLIIAFKLSYLKDNTSYKQFLEVKNGMKEIYERVLEEKSVLLYDKNVNMLSVSEQESLRKEFPLWLIEGNPR